jgi:hypothetical protein
MSVVGSSDNRAKHSVGVDRFGAFPSSLPKAAISSTNQIERQARPVIHPPPNFPRLAVPLSFSLLLLSFRAQERIITASTSSVAACILYFHHSLTSASFSFPSAISDSLSTEGPRVPACPKGFFVSA